MGMDSFYYRKRIGLGCKQVLFGNICWDEFGTDWTIFTEVGCAMVLMLLATLIICIHTVMSIFSILNADTKKDGDFLVGAEDGCCGLLAVGISFVAVDQPIKAKSAGAKRRVLSRLLTLGIQVPILVVTCSALSIISRETAWESQKTSMFVLLVVLMLHLTNLIENLYEVFVSIYD